MSERGHLDLRVHVHDESVRAILDRTRDAETRLRALERAVRELLDGAATADDSYRMRAQWTVLRDAIPANSDAAPAEPTPAAPATYWQGEMQVPDAGDAERSDTWYRESVEGDLRGEIARLTRERNAAESLATLHIQRAERAEAEVGRLRALCGEAARVVAKAKLPYMGEQARAAELSDRLTAAARGGRWRMGDGTVRPAVAIRLDETPDGPQTTLRDYTAIDGDARAIAARVRAEVRAQCVHYTDEGLDCLICAAVADAITSRALGIPTEATTDGQ